MNEKSLSDFISKLILVTTLVLFGILLVYRQLMTDDV